MSEDTGCSAAVHEASGQAEDPTADACDVTDSASTELATVRVPMLRELSLPVPVVTAERRLRDVERAFRDDPDLRAVAVTSDDGTALLTRLHLETMLSGRLGFGRALLSRAAVGDIVAWNGAPFPADLPLRDVAAEILARGLRDDDVLIVDGDLEPIGIVPVAVIFREVGLVFRQIALRDQLTGLPNRRMLDERGAELLATGVDPARMAVLYVDLDGFKQVNDTLGHQAGDALLMAFSRRLARAVRPHDLAGRLGGDEFAVLLFDVDEGEATAVADRIVEVAQQPFSLHDTQLQLSATVGVAMGADLGVASSVLSPLDALLQHADGAMLHAKRAGKARTGRLSAPEAAGAPERRALIRLRLPEALHQGRLRLHYQPKLELRTGQVTSVEALVRWTDEQLGPVSAGELVAVAENTGQINALGDWVLQTACAQARRWRDEGRNWSVAINVSPVQLAAPGLADTVLAAIAETGIGPELLQIEVTESSAVLDIDLASQQLHELQAAGVRVHLDDFGTGYSSLAMLRRLPVSTLKIDQSIVGRIDSDRADAELVSGVISAAHILGLTVIAEGVERPSQLERLRTLGCDSVQGYLIGRPQPALELDDPQAFIPAPR
ncbi:EAL domain-containing protein [Nocardioides sp. BP30]|uniref:putative bifunctional diguanylate cyclase/phosphodiesterase n=1 Tax=Nocardioides sp. BP30 TaxID=3036374 RepID=UPI002468D2F4|nr:EAL domain-containing protein [Nocardioides sp. BP30]WGL51229.1 EAL domain-containing protein [Nocardioides sp. BP30]